MSKRAVVSILTLVQVLGVLRAVSSLVLLRVVDALDPVVGEVAQLQILAVLALVVVAKIVVVEALPLSRVDLLILKDPPPVLDRVVVPAVFVVVLLTVGEVLAQLDLEFGQVEVLDCRGGTVRQLFLRQSI